MTVWWALIVFHLNNGAINTIYGFTSEKACLDAGQKAFSEWHKGESNDPFYSWRCVAQSIDPGPKTEKK